MGPGASGNYGDRWYDVAAPTANGYVGEDADPVVVAQASDALTGIDIAMAVNGGIDGLVRNPASAPISGILVRGELRSDRRVHHNDGSQASPQLGNYYMRGLAPGSYRIIGHDPSGVYETTVLAAAPTVTSGAVATAAPLVMQVPAGDPYEPNNTPAAADAGFDSALFRQNPPQPFETSGSRIGPRNAGDVDFYCFDVLASDRFLISASSMLPGLALDGGAVENPWVDPVVSLWGPPPDGGTTLERLADDDDSGPLLRDARLDTGVLDVAGRYCAAVTTYGDLAWDGTNQGSAGAFRATIAMGNRRPTLATVYQSVPTPVPPATITIAETDTVSVDATWSDPDNDALTATWELRDAASQSVAGASFNAATGAGTATWTASQTAARSSPYSLRVTVADAEFTVVRDIIITVTSVNVAPTTPAQVTPADLATVAEAGPSLVCSASTDVDLDPLQYEFEAYLPGAWDAGVPSVTGLVAGPLDGGNAIFDGGTYPENAWVMWRVRAFDGQTTSAYSAWTNRWRFFVDVANDPPPPPDITKPTEGEEVLVRRPTLAVDNPIDPEGDTVTLNLQIAEDTAFSTGLQNSGTVALNTAGSTTSWTVTGDLAWGRTMRVRIALS